ncbi:hypothetical protein PZE06_25475 [Robertmurraya sp. DFI.2.37]|uniref:hypothetical protein n=1 Tax=Robertmurraya sp. DFI.2.37 TaxID=3031819 RepID=UPI00124497BD|nr:hypothetical protein [Robertmurraya sp. DFI.2.37]MDF1511453.1 hypothetical protein [Robertmurraya sp. DFI.2.37]
MDFYKDLSEILMVKFKEIGIEPPKGDLCTILKGYINLSDKLINNKKRNVKVSNELKEQDFGEHYNLCLQQIRNKFKNGIDVNGYLSKGAFKPSQRDLLLYDWGIHHLHINNKFDNGGFVERSDYLLFFIIDENNVYFIDVTRHKLENRTEFSQQELLRIVKRNWPYLIEPYRLKGFSSLEKKLTDKEHSEIRNSGAMAVVEIEGDIYGMIGGGITTARTNVQHTTKIDMVVSFLRDITKTMQENRKNFIDSPYSNKMIHLTESYKLILENECFYIINEKTGLKIIESPSLYKIIFN